MSYCEKCGINNACERTDLVGKPVLCDACWLSELLGDCDCDLCFNGYLRVIVYVVISKSVNRDIYRRCVMLYNPRNYQKSINKSIRLSQPYMTTSCRPPAMALTKSLRTSSLMPKSLRPEDRKLLKCWMIGSKIYKPTIIAAMIGFVSWSLWCRLLYILTLSLKSLTVLLARFWKMPGNVYLNRSSGSWQSAVKMRYNTFCISIPLQLRSDPGRAGVHFEIQE